jgi:hypothetical protein
MRLEDLPIEDRQAVEDFTAFLNGNGACLLCMMPTAECRASDEPCCPNCKHGRLRRVEGPAASEFHNAPHLLVKDAARPDGAGPEAVES